MSLHAEPFMQHELPLRLQLLATQNISSRPFTTALHFGGYQKPATTEAHKKTSIFREDYTTVNNPHRELQNYSSCPISLLVLRSRTWFLILLQRCTTIQPLVSLPFEY